MDFENCIAYCMSHLCKECAHQCETYKEELRKEREKENKAMEEEYALSDAEVDEMIAQMDKNLKRKAGV